MVATLATLAGVLKEFYLGPIVEQLNREVFVLDTFEKATVDWSGRVAVIPVHLAANGSVGYSLAGNLPGSGGAAPAGIGQQQYGSFNINAQNMYGEFEINGNAIASMRTGRGSFVGYVDAEMNKLVEDMRDTANATAVTGGASFGYIWEKVDVVGPAVGVFQYAGQVAGINAGGANDFIECIRGDTYNLGGALGVTPVPNTTQLGAITAATLTNAAGSILNVGPGVAIPAGTMTAVMCAQAATNTTKTDVTTGLAGAPNEPAGIIENLASPVHFGISRDSQFVGPVAPAAALRSTTRTSNTNGDTYAAPVLGDFQSLLDDIDILSGKTPNMWLMNPAQRVSYTNLLVGAAAGNLVVDSEKAKHGDGGFLTLGYAGIPIRSSRGCPTGLIFALHTKSWKLCELQKGGFADLDGSILSRVPGSDAYRGYWRWYYNVICTQPNANGVLGAVL